jgi:putative peptidoglycan lipid II flippase
LPARLRRASRLLVLLTAAIAVSSYARELVLAAVFGVGGSMDAFFLTLAIVQTVHDLLFVGSLSAAVVPLLSGFDAGLGGHPAQRGRFVVTTALLVAILAVALAAIMWALMPQIIDLLAPRLPDAVRATAVEFGHWLAWLLPAQALVALMSLVLNARGCFVFATLPYLANNLLFIVAVALLAPMIGAQALPVACFAGPAVMLPLLAVRLARMGLLPVVPPEFSARLLAPLWRLVRPNLLSAGIGSSIGLLMVSHLILRSFAAGHGEGAVAAVSYAYRLYEVPLSLIVNPTAIVIFPLVAGMYAQSRPADIGRLCRALLVWGAVILFPVAVVACAGADMIVDLVLRRGRFAAEAARMTAEALRGFAPAIVFEAVVVVLFRVCLAMHRPGIPVIASLVALASLSGVLMATAGGPLIGLALSLSCAFGVAALALIATLFGLIGRDAVPPARVVAGWSAAALTALGAFALAAWWAADELPARLAAIAIFLASYLVAVLVLVPECRALAADLIGSGPAAHADDTTSPDPSPPRHVS